MAELQFRAAAAGYDRSVGEMTRRIVPSLLGAARLAPGMRVLDIATGTGLAAEAALSVVGPTGHVVAADISRAMIAADGSFDAVLCNMGLMYFPDPGRGLLEFRRVLRAGGRAAASVFTRADRALVGGLIRGVIARHVPAKAGEYERFFSPGEGGRLRALFEGAGFAEVEIATQMMRFAFPSFDAYFGGIERGEGHMGQEYLALPEAVRRAVREEMRREVGDTGGPVEVEVEVEVKFASGRR
jgi:SAM-dependent methyltransferase